MPQIPIAEDRVISATGPSQADHRTYFPHVDGMRCIAVMAVMVYHIASSLCPAGMLGVDIFFVISGYLICGGILTELQKGVFSLSSFYHRRIRRIFPAYFVVVFCTLLFGMAIYHWARLVPLAQTALFSALFSGNIYFWLDTGYFQPNAHGNPLLNLWSLGVEEHFYIVIPLFCLILWRTRLRRIKVVFLAGLLASLAACVYLGHSGNSTTAFYILPTRAWELLAGALIANLPAARQNLRSTVLSLLGFVLILMSLWCLSTERTYRGGGTSVELILPFLGSVGFFPFPGWVTIPVIAGSVLLVRFGGTGLASILLRSGLFVGIGRISYSLYLWHWPLLVFARYICYDELSPAVSGLVFLLSFAAAYASWRWVETPTRLGKWFTPRFAFSFAASSCAVLIAGAALLISTEGFRGSLHPQANALAAPPRSFLPNLQKFAAVPTFQAYAYPLFDTNFVRLLGVADGRPSFCLIGDSHAQALAPGLDVVAREHRQTGLFVTKSLHPFIDEKTGTVDQQILQWVAARPDIRDIYMVGRWMNMLRVRDGLPSLGMRGRVEPVVLNDSLAQALEANFRETAHSFLKHGKRVFVFTSVPDYAYSPSDILARSRIIPTSLPVTVTRQDYANRQRPITQILNKLQEQGLLTAVPLETALLSAEETIVQSAKGIPLYKDCDHLTFAGAYDATQAIVPWLWPDRTSQ